MGRSGEAMLHALHAINPQIYGTLTDPDHVELEGLLYVFQRLPKGIEQCRYVKLISREGYESSDFQAIIPAKRRRNCYRIDDEQMLIEMTRGGSDVYDVLTHLTFMYNEAEKIGRNALNNRRATTRTWKMLSKIVKLDKLTKEQERIAVSYLSSLLGRTFDETWKALQDFRSTQGVNSLYTICYWLGKISIEETLDKNDREISFSTALREQVGLHTFGEQWAQKVKQKLQELGLIGRRIHVISANMHSVMNSIYAKKALGRSYSKEGLITTAKKLSASDQGMLRDKVRKSALAHGLTEVLDISGTNISVQIIDLCNFDLKDLPSELSDSITKKSCDDVIVVMDYAFGEQAYETMDELLKPYETADEKIDINIGSVNIMGKAGILEGKKGDIMIPSAHIFEGSTDNYIIDNALKVEDLEPYGLPIFVGPMITVLGTSLQNRDILRYFLKSSWSAIGLEMEGAHYQKAIQVASKVRKSIAEDVSIRYAYYASDNPLESGSTLASGSLGLDGVEPTYAITLEILKAILS